MRDLRFGETRAQARGERLELGERVGIAAPMAAQHYPLFHTALLDAVPLTRAARPRRCSPAMLVPAGAADPLLILLLALALDLFLGDMPAVWRHVPHPVTWVGAAIRWLDRRLNREQRSDAVRRAARRALGHAARGRGGRRWDWRSRRRSARSPMAGWSRPQSSRCCSRRRASSTTSPAVATSLQQGGLLAGRAIGAPDRRPRSREPRRAWRGARGDRIAGREFQRRRRGTRAVVRGVRPPRPLFLQDRQHARQHDRLPLAAPSRLRLGGGAARRCREPACRRGSRRSCSPSPRSSCRGRAGAAPSPLCCAMRASTARPMPAGPRRRRRRARLGARRAAALWRHGRRRALAWHGTGAGDVVRHRARVAALSRCLPGAGDPGARGARWRSGCDSGLSAHGRSPGDAAHRAPPQGDRRARRACRRCAPPSEAGIAAAAERGKEEWRKPSLAKSPWRWQPAMRPSRDTAPSPRPSRRSIGRVAPGPVVRPTCIS